MTFILLNMYIFFYIIIFLALNIVILKFLPNNIYIKSPMNTFIIFIQKHNKYANVFLLLLLTLTGLPPVIFFFIKINILFYLFNKINIISILFLFIFYFINMLFYLQIFKHKNTSINLSPYLNKYTMNTQENKFISNKSTKKDFKFLQNLIILLIIIYFSFFFFFDFFLITKLYF